ncbi:MAG: hypothetical protein M1830_007202 [Pleopsidium flavum]|nr:MAG: hypothetical protein M1830_007202 [Pleopsidium flavum]
MAMVGVCYVGWAMPVSSREFMTKIAMDEAVWHALDCFPPCHRFGERSQVFVARLPTEIANMIRRYLRMAVRADVETAIESVTKCYFRECNCSAENSIKMRQHLRAEVV